MNCKQLETLVVAEADGEVDALRSYSEKKHLHACAGSSPMHRSSHALRARIRSEVTYFAASPALQARVCATVGAVRATALPRSNPKSDRWRWLSGGVLAGCTASVFAWMLGTTVLAWHVDAEIAGAAVAAHVRATRGDHPIEVASSDRHTVKPWLSARLDYSPPVRDLANEGFTLIGGRLDYLERRPVATLIYRHGKHTIDVFVRPEGSRASTQVPRAVRGFNVAHARGPSMDWVAVSDVGPVELSAFVQRLAREDISQ